MAELAGPATTSSGDDKEEASSPGGASSSSSTWITSNGATAGASVPGSELDLGSGTNWDNTVAHLSDTTKNDHWEGGPSTRENRHGFQYCHCTGHCSGGQAPAVGLVPKIHCVSQVLMSSWWGNRVPLRLQRTSLLDTLVEQFLLLPVSAARKPETASKEPETSVRSMEGFPRGGAVTYDAMEEAGGPCTILSPVALAGKESWGMGGTGRNIKFFATWNASSIKGAHRCMVLQLLSGVGDGSDSAPYVESLSSTVTLGRTSGVARV